MQKDVYDYNCHTYFTQTACTSDLTAFRMSDRPETRSGVLVETPNITNPQTKQTEDFFTDRFG